jgi:diacylglycerol kinase (ATP)
MIEWVSVEGRRIWKTCVWSLAGWKAAWASEKTLRQWSLMNLLSVGLSLCISMSPAERALIWALGLLILAAELMNTGIEEVVDYISTAEDPRAKKAKDCGSAAVAVTAIAAGMAWVVVLVG